MVDNKIRAYLALTRLDRPVGIFLLLWPTWWALWIAGQGQPDIALFIVFTLGVILMRSAGCAINDYADRDFDGHVTRTQNRPLATGAVSAREALYLFAALVAAAFILVLFLNPLTIALSLVAVALAATYPFGKRFHHLPQLQLGLAFGWAIPMAFAAQTESVPLIAWLLLAANLAWVLAYDTIYAIADRPDDLKIGVKSSAILFGRYDLLAVSLAYATTLILLALIGWQLTLNSGFYLILAIAALSVIWIMFTASTRTLADCVLAFKRNILFGGVVMIAFIIGFL